MRRTDGFTLVELVITVGILAVLLSIAFALLLSATQTERGTQVRADKLAELRQALARVSKDTRQALSVTTASTSTRLEMLTLVNGANYTVVYTATGTSLTRSAAPEGTPVGAANVIATGLSSTAVFCYDPPACAVANPASTHPAIVRITLAGKPQGRDVVITAREDVELRNS